MGDVQLIRSYLRVHRDFPKPGINFIDLFPVLQNPVAFEALITHFIHHITSHTFSSSGIKNIDVVVGLDARGFLLGPIIAMRLGAAFVPVRKKGKLPGSCTAVEYEKEYGKDIFEMQAGAIPKDATVIVVDDLIATGGSAKAAGDLVKLQGGNTVEFLFVIGLPFLKGVEKLGAPSYVMIEAEGS